MSEETAPAPTPATAPGPAMEARGAHRAELIALLGEMADLVAGARSMPMSSSALINREEITELIDRAQQALPGELAKAEAILTDADTVLKRANEQKIEIIANAQLQASELVSREKVVIKAREEAENIVSQAREDARKLAQSTDDWCDRRLAEVEIDAEAFVKQVRAGRARLAERMGQLPPGTAENLGEDGAIE